MTEVSQSKPETSLEFIARLKDPNRWRSAVYDLVLWFMFGVVFTEVVTQATPGYPIVVGTSSISTGVYWLDKTKYQLQRHEYVSFTFKPGQAYLQRYGEGTTHTKSIRAVEGDTITARADGTLTVCWARYSELVKEHCETAGKPRAADSKGRALTPWLKPGQQYTLQADELWIYAPNERSLDSRYYGPISRTAIHGVAKPLWIWSPAPKDPTEKT